MITLKSDNYNNKFLSHWCMTDYEDESVKMSNASFWKKNLLFFYNFLGWRMIWCVFWKTTYTSQISNYFGACSIIFTWNRTGITESCCSHVQGREITQIFVELLYDFQHQMSQTCQEVKLFLKRIVKFSIQNTKHFSPFAPSVLWRMQVLLWCLKFSKLPLSVKQKYILLIKHTTLEWAFGGT